jgi:hypothetical protein
MARAKESGYEAGAFFGFLDSVGERRDDGGFVSINELPVNFGHRDMLSRWERWSVIPTSKLDRFLMQYDLMLFELENWAEDHLGYCGFLPTGTTGLAA